MKKIVSSVCLILIILSMKFTAYAGSIPEDLLHNDGAQIFFAEVLSYHGENSTVTVSPVKKIKGEVATGTQQHYDNANTVGDFKVRNGNVYLFTYFDANNPTEIFEVTSYDTSTLKIKNTTGDMWKRFEEYLNDGKYEKAEQDRINRINAKLTEVGDEITLTAITETNNEKCDKVEFGVFGKNKRYEIDKSEFYRLADDIRLIDVENVLVMEPEGGLVIRCSEGTDIREVIVYDNCKVAGSRVMMYSAPTGDYIIKAEDFNKLLSLLPEDAQTKLPPLKNLHANLMYWFIFNSRTAYIIGMAALVVLLGAVAFIIKNKRKKNL